MTFVPPAFVEPAFLHIPPGRTGSLGPEIVDFAASIGHPVDPEQAADIDAFASLGAGGLYLGGTVCKIEGRQNGKTDRVILPMTMFDFFVLGVPAVTWTAHLMDTTRKTKAIVERLVEANPSLSARVKEIIDARDSEAIVLMSGAVWEWRARSDAGGRGGQAVDGPEFGAVFAFRRLAVCVGPEGQAPAARRQTGPQRRRKARPPRARLPSTRSPKNQKLRRSP